METSKIVDQTQTLLALGFEEVGTWTIDAEQLRCTLIKHADKAQSLYAFVAGHRVLYLGKSIRTLAKRLYGYQKPGPTQHTNIRNHSLLKEILATGQPVQVWALVVSEPVVYRGWQLNVAAGLEDILIAHLSPIWNRLGVKNTLRSEE